VGSGVGAFVWPLFGWVGVGIAGLVFAALAGLNHLRGRPEPIAAAGGAD
jgi:hypothetical protein